MKFKEEVENPMILPFEEEPVRKVSQCTYCGVALFSDEEFYEWDGLHFCSSECTLAYLDVRNIEGWEIG